MQLPESDTPVDIKNIKEECIRLVEILHDQFLSVWNLGFTSEQIGLKL